MSLSKEKARKNLAKLVEKFEKELSSGEANEYNEEATKTSFIQPLLNSTNFKGKYFHNLKLKNLPYFQSTI